ncbi:MAG: dephospho-CoA kinase, partial [Ignavibacteriaceae bacterium]
MNKKKLKIAITGNIGSGKSVFTDFIKKYNYPVINADDLSKSILEKNPSVKKEVIKLFGNQAYKNDKPDRRYIADIVFNDQHKLSLLEKILHPVVIKETIELMDASLIMNDRVFVEAALIYEADMEKYFDLVIL